MNAQTKWKKEYQAMMLCKRNGFLYEAHEHRMYAGENYRREAALERQIAAQQRQHESDQRRIAELEAEINHAKELADIQDATTLSDWICGVQSEIANLGGQLRDIWDAHSADSRGITQSEFNAMMDDEALERQHERRDQLDAWSDETPLGIALDGIGDEIE